MKRILSVFLALLIALGCCACGQGGTDTPSVTPGGNSTEQYQYTPTEVTITSWDFGQMVSAQAGEVSGKVS